MQLAELLNQLDNVKQAGDEFSARCPAHEDQRNSLSLRQGERGIVLHCHAGCSVNAVCAAIGVDIKHLFPDNGRKTQRIEKCYAYRDATGQLLYEVVRFFPKKFRQRRPYKNHFAWGLSAGRYTQKNNADWYHLKSNETAANSESLPMQPTTLYLLPELIQADKNAPVFICEGEKDCERLKNLGLIATTNTGGAKKWKSEYNEFLRGRRCIILPDNDTPGREHAEQVAASLQGVVASVKTIMLSHQDHGDVSDWLDAGHSVNELLSLATSSTVVSVLDDLKKISVAHKAIDEVIEIFRKHFYLPQPYPLLSNLGAVMANYLPGDPVWLLTVGSPSTGKTEILNSLSLLPHVVPVAVLSEAALLSGSSKRDQSVHATGGLLRQVGRFGILAVKDFSGVLTMRVDARGPVLSALREVYDGNWNRYVGTDGGRTLSWTGKCGFIGCATGAIDSQHAVMGALGERFALIRMPEVDEKIQTRHCLRMTGRENEIREELSAAVQALFAGVEVLENKTQLTDQETDRLITLGALVCRARSPVERDGYKRELINKPGIESPPRFVKMLTLLLGGLDALKIDRDTSWNILNRIGWDSMPRIRKSILDYMRTRKGVIITSDVASNINYPTTTTRRALEDLAAYNVIAADMKGQGSATYWYLSEWTQRKLNEMGFTQDDTSFPYA